MITIYHVPGTRSVRPLWLCYELELPCQVVTIDFSKRYRNSAEWRAISPGGKVPACQDGDLTLFESGAIVQYLLDRYGQGRLQPAADSIERAHYLQWCWFSEATLARPLGINRIAKGLNENSSTLAQDGLDKARESLQVIEAVLQQRPYLLAEGFTAADIMMGYSLILAEHLDLIDVTLPATSNYLTNLKARPSCRKALAA